MGSLATLLRLGAILLATQLSVACAQSQSDGVALQQVFPEVAISRPVALLQTPAAPSTSWYVVEKNGRVLRIEGDGTSSQSAVFVDISDRVEAGPSEAGLLGMAFHPDFGNNGQVYLSYTRGGPLTSVLSRFTSHDGGISLDPSSEEVLLEVAQPYSNHNGGQIAFGPDGYLYYGLGDGGAGGDPHGNGQNTQTLLGAMLRLDVNGPSPYAIPPDNPFVAGGARPELYAWGLRNPWRWSFDRQTGALWLADVGQDAWEEIDLVAKGDNLGWNAWEGSHCYTPGACRSEGVVMPRAEYSHEQGCSVTGGYVYRGQAVPVLYGKYVYGDFCSGTIWELDSGNRQATPRILIESGMRISSFAEDRAGELYLLDYATGRIFRLVAAEG